MVAILHKVGAVTKKGESTCKNYHLVVWSGCENSTHFDENYCAIFFGNEV